MTPFAQAAEAHGALGCGWPFVALVEAHALHGGYVFITPDCFLMGRPIRRDWPSKDIANPAKVASDPDCWHVWLMAGELSALLALIPYPLPFVSFHRRGVLRVRPMLAVERALSGV